MSVNAKEGEASDVERFSMVIQKMRQLRIQKTAIRLTRRSAVRSFDSSALQPDFTISDYRNPVKQPEFGALLPQLLCTSLFENLAALLRFDSFDVVYPSDRTSCIRTARG